jgi:hypothetical protein
MEKQTQIRRILAKLKSKKKVYNYELNPIAFRYSARIKDLRSMGINIVTNREEKGVFSFSLIK